MAAVIDQLQQLGFSQYEAQAYVTLLKQEPLNGYELAKASGIPRPNIYPVLQKLEERGAILRLDSPTGTRYTPIAPAELLARLKEHYDSALENAGKSLHEVPDRQSSESILNVRGYDVLLDTARGLIAAARQKLLLALWPPEVMALGAEMAQAEARGVDITTLCLGGCPQPCAKCQGSLYRYRLAPPGAERWLVVIPDGEEVLAGEINPPDDALAVRTRHKMLVNLAAGYIQNSIALFRVLAVSGGRLNSLIDPETREMLDRLAPLQAGENWLDSIHTLIHQKENSQ